MATPIDRQQDLFASPSKALPVPGPGRGSTPETADMATLLSMIQSLMDQVSALRIQSERTSIVPGPSNARSPSETPGLHAVTFLPTLGLDPQWVSSEHASLVPGQSKHPLLVDHSFYGSPETRDVQILSDGLDPTYEAWSIQLEGKFLEPRFLDNCEERFRMHYVFSVTSGTAQNHLCSRMSRTVSNLFRSVNDMLKVLETAFVNPNRIREAGMEYRQLMMGATDTFVDFKTRFLLLANEAGVPQSSRRLDLYDKLMVELQASLVAVLSTLPTFGDLCTRVIKVDQEWKWICQ
jgi:hypothetical protein